MLNIPVASFSVTTCGGLFRLGKVTPMLNLTLEGAMVKGRDHQACAWTIISPTTTRMKVAFSGLTPDSDFCKPDSFALVDGKQYPYQSSNGRSW